LSKEGNEFPTYDKKERRLTGLVASCVRPPSKTCYLIQNRRKDESDGKTRKKMEAVTVCP